MAGTGPHFPGPQTFLNCRPFQITTAHDLRFSLTGAHMAALHQLPFEKPLYELEERLLKLEAQQDPTPAEKESMRRMRVELTQMTRERFANLDPWQIVHHAARNRSNCSKLSNRDITRRVIRSARTAKHWLQRNGFVTPVFSLDDQLSNYLTESEFTHNQFRTNGQAAYQRVANSGA